MCRTPHPDPTSHRHCFPALFFPPTRAADEWVNRTFRAACTCTFAGGLIEMAGASLGNIIRNNVPKAALYAPIAAVGFVWLALGPLTVVAREPLIGIFFFRPPHPFLPYAAPHFSHISHVYSCFFC